MTKVEEIVARWEAGDGAIISQHEIDAIIASWRERGEALAKVADIQWAERRGQGRSREELADYLAELQHIIAIAALKDKP